MKALEGIRVLDLSAAIAAPYCAQVLADLGADVIKVEHPGRAFSERTALSPAGWDGPAFAPFFMACNRNKRSLTLNLKHSVGRKVLADLVRRSDVVIENFGADAREDLVDEHWAWEVNPRVVWASMSFCGRTGPESNLDGLDLIAQARSGLMSITGMPEGPPTKAGSSVTDYLAGAHLAIGVLAALRQREMTGIGQLVDTSLLENAVACLDGLPLWHTVADITPTRVGNRHPSGHLGYATYECTDGFIATSVHERRLGDLIPRVLRRPELLPVPDPEEPSFRPHMTRVVAAFAEWASERTVDEVCDALTEIQMPVAPVRNLAEIWDDEQLEARGMFVEYEYANLGKFKAIGNPIHLSGSPSSVLRSPPEVGEHNEQVLRDVLGYDEHALADLVERGVLWDWDPDSAGSTGQE
jgi:CoA:oxalate CoA-transferase